ncbi:SAM-dependent methyltransferase [Kitasatospora sp. GAS204A]|uniref:methyltransferase domain-containing protein n=1 Tax=unclassified Kitasatospora TaxID=2633591 RepID=UPI002474D198|nr:methyltransferase domain-containing protein [Kitasatospora sp. GAS204B]MDH6121065.1 SAM-dependent methyltransferase [Kitasatospora sp. GAS204B]
MTQEVAIGSARSFEDLMKEADSVSVDGWDFSWLDGRASEERPSWGYQKLMSARLASASAALDIQTGGGEVLAGARRLAYRLPPYAAATEGWPPNLARAAKLLQPRGVTVVPHPDQPPFPFGDESFDLVTSRLPSPVWWAEIARVLQPGGAYFAQHLGPDTLASLAEFFGAPCDTELQNRRHPYAEAEAAKSAGLDVVDIRFERLRVEFFDIGAVVYFLRKVVWAVPGFTVERYRDRLRSLHQQIVAEGPFVTYSTRTLIEARKPKHAEGMYDFAR